MLTGGTNEPDWAGLIAGMRRINITVPEADTRVAVIGDRLSAMQGPQPWSVFASGYWFAPEQQESR